MKEQKGISLIVLVITIIVMVIIAGAVIVSVGNIISESTKATFYQDMGQLEHEKEISKIMTFLDNKENGNESKTETVFLSRNLTTEELAKLKDTLKAEIVYIRNSFGEREVFTTKQVWKNNMFDCQEVYTVPEYLEGLSNDIYYIVKEVTSAKNYEFIYDRVSDTCFKIQQTSIGKYIVHSLKYAKFAIDKEGVQGVGTVEFEAKAVKASDGTLAYEPDLNNFSYATQVVYYSPDFKTEYTMPIKEFINAGCPSTKIIDGKQYTFVNYSLTSSGSVWGNIKTTANGLDSYWVWIPRYAYKLNQEKQTADIIFIDVNNKPLDTIKYGNDLPEGYTLHEGFTQKDGLKGVWFSKYEPTAVETVPVDKAEAHAPDLTGFNTEELKLVYYTADEKKNIEVEYTENPSQTIEKDGTTYYWYSYDKGIWGNIKTTANGLDAYWVWIPRYAYKLESGQSSVILVDVNDKPLDTKKYGDNLPNGYKLHEGFTQKDGLKGIWFSKYEPSKVEATSTTNQ